MGAAKMLTEKPQFYRLYSKYSITRFEVVIWDHDYNLVFKTNETLNEDNKIISESRALMRGLTEATNLGISRIYIYCNHHTIFQYLSRRLDPKNRNIALLINDLQRMRKRFRYSNLVMVDSPVRRSLYPGGTKQVKKETSCFICFEDVDPVHMFPVDECGHRFCINCIKQHIEVKLLDGTIPTCPQLGCNSQISIDRCGELLTRKLSFIWKRMTREELIPFTERVYCPYPKCSFLMSKTDLSSTSVESGLRRCFKCSGSFCVHCKVPWHNTLSCTDYNKFRPNDYDVQVKTLANHKGWKRCNKCQHMIERSSGCNHMRCRCGNNFCYDCGAELRNGRCQCRHEFCMFRPATIRPENEIPSVRPENEMPSVVGVGLYLGLSVMAFGVFYLIMINSVW